MNFNDNIICFPVTIVISMALISSFVIISLILPQLFDEYFFYKKNGFKYAEDSGKYIIFANFVRQSFKIEIGKSKIMVLLGLLSIGVGDFIIFLLFTIKSMLEYK
jgi:hypothetical protein